MIANGKIIKAIVIGASAGGIKALLELLAPLPASFPLPIIIVLHLPEKGESRLASVFQYHLSLPVFEARDKEHIAPGAVYFAPPGCHLSIEKDFSFSLSGEEPLRFSRPAIDILMTTAADTYGKALIGIILTGANSDGAEGLAAIKSAGGRTIVQNPADAEISTMPQAAINFRKPDFILSLREIRALLIDLENPNGN